MSSAKLERIFFKDESKHFPQVFCRNRRVIFVKVVVCCAHYMNSLFLWNVCVETCDVHSYKKCSFFHLCFFNEIYKISCIFKVGLLWVACHSLLFLTVTERKLSELWRCPASHLYSHEFIYTWKTKFRWWGNVPRSCEIWFSYGKRNSSLQEISLFIARQ